MRHFEEETEKATSLMESSGDERKPVKVLAERAVCRIEEGEGNLLTLIGNVKEACFEHAASPKL